MDLRRLFMSPTLIFDPLSNSASFESIKVKLSGERIPYLVGFRLSDDPTDVVDAQSNPAWPGYRFDIVPYNSVRGSQMRHPLAAIWYSRFQVSAQLSRACPTMSFIHSCPGLYSSGRPHKRLFPTCFP